jgi:hypothetical protein
MPHTPSNDPEALDLLFAQLRLAKSLYESDKNRQRRPGTISALAAVADYLRTLDQARADGLHVPILALAMALHDLECGVPHPLFAIDRKVGRRSLESSRAKIHVSAAAILDHLRKTGLKQQEAAGLIARRLNTLGMRTLQGHRITAETVIGWRRKFRRQKGNPEDIKLYQGLVRDAPIDPDADPAEVRRELLGCLDDTVSRYYFPG